MWYETVYAWRVFRLMEKGTKVYCLDREKRVVLTVNDMQVSDAFEIVKLAEKESDRFDFWIEKTEEEENA